MLLRGCFIALILLACCVDLDGSAVQAFQCGPTKVCPPALAPVCDPPVVPMAPCCGPSPLYPPGPPLVAPVIVAPVPLACAPSYPPPLSDYAAAHSPRTGRVHAAN